MKFKDMEVNLIYGGLSYENGEFIKNNHYSNSIARGCMLNFELVHNNILIGLAMVGEPVSNRCQDKYSLFGGKVMELKRLCLIDDTPKNSESFFLGKIMKIIQKETDVEVILSYADPEFDHSGVIYKAANFDIIGREQYPSVKYRLGDRAYHKRQLYGDSKTSKMLKEALALGILEKIHCKPKHIYTYRFKRKYGVFSNDKVDYINHKANKLEDVFIGEL